MKMNRIGIVGLAIVAGGIITATVFSGCMTTSIVTPAGVTNTVTVLRPEAITGIRAAVAALTPVAVAEDPNARPYLSVVANVFTIAAESGNYDPVALQASLDSISIKELRSNSTAKQITEMALAAYKGVFADSVNAKLDATTWGPFAMGFLGAVGDGINAGMPAAAPVTPAQ